MQKKQLFTAISILIFFLLIFQLNVSADTEIWKDEVTLQEMSMLPGRTSIAVDKENIHVFWSDWPTEFNSYLCYRKSTDNGKTWTDRKILTAEVENISIEPKITIINNTLHLIWKDYRNGNPEIYYKKSVDNGETWTNDTQLTFNNPRKTNIYEHKIKGNKDFILVVWKDHMTGSSEIYLKKSVDNGDSWSETKRLTEDFTPSYDPDFTIDGENVYLVWESGGLGSEISFKRSIDSGKTWTDAVDLTVDNNSEAPRIAIYNKTLYLVWQEDSIYESYVIYFKKSDDHGKTWTEGVRLTDGNSSSLSPQIAVYNNNVYVAWLESVDSNLEVFFKKSTDGGKTWGNNTQLTYDDVGSHDLTFANQGKNLYLAWQNYYMGDGAEIKFMQNINKIPVITLFESSDESIGIPEKIDVYIEGIDANYSNTALQCTVSYKNLDTNGTEHTLNAEYDEEKNRWTVQIDFNNNTQEGTYEIKAMLSNPLGFKDSKVLYISANILENGSNLENSTPGFELFLLIIALFFVAIYHKNRNK